MALAMNSVTTALPWHHQQWHHVNQLITDQRLPHALVLSGPDGCGKTDFAKALAQRLLCQHPRDGIACGNCGSCGYVVAGSHPDLQWLEPDQPGRFIKVDQIRFLVDSLAKTAQLGGRRVVVIEPADAMNRNAANALLKSLEEPGQEIVIMLLSAAPGRLLPTIRSRCQLLNLPLPDSDSATEWLRPLVGDGVSTLLRFGRGRPVQALHLFESGAVEQLTTIADQYQLLRRKEISPIALAQKWNEYSLSTVLDTLLGEVDDELRAKLLQQSAGAKARDRFIKARDSIVLLQQRIQNGLNPNAQLALEDILLQLR